MMLSLDGRQCIIPYPRKFSKYGFGQGVANIFDTCIYIYIYMCTNTQGERGRERESDRKKDYLQALMSPAAFRGWQLCGASLCEDPVGVPMQCVSMGGTPACV